MRVFPNPYHALDHKARLAGACPEATPPGLPPTRRFIGAKHDMTEGSYKGDDAESFIAGRGDVFWRFVSEPVELFADQTAMHFYLQRMQGDEFFAAEGGVPMAQLVTARAKAIADHVAAYGKEPDTSFWKEQFALDSQVASEGAAPLAPVALARPKDLARKDASVSLVPTDAKGS